MSSGCKCSRKKNLQLEYSGCKYGDKIKHGRNYLQLDVWLEIWS